MFGRAEIVVMRHGQAEEFADGGDAQRILTGEGQRMAERAGELLKVAGLLPTVAIASPFVRAQQTVARALRSAGAALNVVEEPRLVPSAPPDLAITALIEAAARASGRVFAVGHNPCITAVLGRLVAGGAMRFAVSTGDVAHLAVDVEQRTAVLLGYVPASVLAGLAASKT